MKEEGDNSEGGLGMRTDLWGAAERKRRGGKDGPSQSLLGCPNHARRWTVCERGDIVCLLYVFTYWRTHSIVRLLFTVSPTNSPPTQVDGLRGDIVCTRAARALCALECRTEVGLFYFRMLFLNRTLLHWCSGRCGLEGGTEASSVARVKMTLHHGCALHAIA